MSYNISINEVCQAQLRDTLARYSQAGRGEEIHEAASTLLQHIRTMPHEMGEMAYWLPSGRPVYSLACMPLRFYYAVYEAEKVIWIFRVIDMNATDPPPNE